MSKLGDVAAPYKTTSREKVVRIRHRYPARIEKLYRNYMQDIIDQLNRQIKGGISDTIKADIRNNQDGFRTDALSDVLRAIRDALVNIIAPDMITRRIANAIFGANERNVGQAVERAVGVNIALPGSQMSDAIESWVVENVSYITKLQTDYLTSIQGVVAKGFQAGLNYREISKQITERTGISKRRATLIARDQVGSLNAQVTEKRNEELGIDSYIWRTVEDERVRGNPAGRYPKAKPSHYARNGKQYTWKDGAGSQDKHPGVGIQCRCYAESVIKI